MAKAKNSEKAVKPNIFMRLGLFIKQIIDELRKVVTPTSKELFFWALAVFIFVLLLMALVTGMDFMFYYLMPGYSGAMERYLTTVLPMVIYTAVLSPLAMMAVRRVAGHFVPEQ